LKKSQGAFPTLLAFFMVKKDYFPMKLFAFVEDRGVFVVSSFQNSHGDFTMSKVSQKPILSLWRRCARLALPLVAVLPMFGCAFHNGPPPGYQPGMRVDETVECGPDERYHECWKRYLDTLNPDQRVNEIEREKYYEQSRRDRDQYRRDWERREGERRHQNWSPQR